MHNSDFIERLAYASIAELFIEGDSDVSGMKVNAFDLSRLQLSLKLLDQARAKPLTLQRTVHSHLVESSALVRVGMKKNAPQYPIIIDGDEMQTLVFKGKAYVGSGMPDRLA